jgi:soluble lytic murein transglycosylase-like protein
MSRRLDLTLAATALLCMSLPATLQAEIYYWRDANGRIVISDKPKDPSAQTYEVQQSATIRTTRPVVSRRAVEYDGLIEAHSRDHGVDANLVRAVIQAESAYNPRAVSHKGAMGLMQLMPATAKQYDVIDPFDPAENIRAGVAYLKSLLVKYGEKLELALAAYNAGPGAVAKYGDVPPYRETRNYVKKIKGAVDAKPAPQAKIYKTIEMVNGRPVARYSTKQTPGSELVSSATRR